jgi:hypothetical protein
MTPEAESQMHAHDGYNGRQLVPIVGTGFIRWLVNGVGASPILTDWWALLRSVAEDASWLPDDVLKRKLEPPGDAAFAWEALLAVGAERAHTRRRVSDVEAELLRKVSTVIERAEEEIAGSPVVTARWQRFLTALWGGVTAPAGDLLSLNFSIPGVGLGSSHDLGTNSLSEETGAPRSGRCTIPASGIRIEGGPRIWFPHGHRAAPDTMILGTHRYVRSADYVVRAFEAFKKAERVDADRRSGDAEVHEHNAHPAGSTDLQSWVSAALNAPLLLLGVGLDRTEVDLWEFLHLRARNHAGLPADRRPPIWRLTSDEESPDDQKHWASLSSGLTVQKLEFGSTWDEAWEMLLARASNDRTRALGP